MTTCLKCGTTYEIPEGVETRTETSMELLQRASVAVFPVVDGKIDYWHPLHACKYGVAVELPLSETWNIKDCDLVIDADTTLTQAEFDAANAYLRDQYRD